MCAIPPLVDQLLRPLCLADAPWLAALHSQAFDPPWSEASFADLLALPTTQGWALRDTPSLILFQLSEGDAEILTFQVAAEHQGQGHGGSLLLSAMEEIWGLGAISIYLEVAESRIAARALYANLGFSEIGRRKGYYGTNKGREDALVCRISRKIDPLP